MIRAAFAIAFLAAAAPVAAQNSYPAYHPAQPRNDFERCIVAAWTAAVARRQVRGTSYGGDVGTWTALGDDGRLVVRARYGAQSGRWEVHVDATTTITGLEAVTVFRGTSAWARCSPASIASTRRRRGWTATSPSTSGGR